MNGNDETVYDIICPYCFRPYSNGRAMFADFRSTADEVYPQYTEYLKNFLGIGTFAGRTMPLYFSRQPGDTSGSPFTATTGNGDIAYTRVCPNCCNILPAASGRMKSFSIAVLGSDEDERNLYLTALLHRVNREMSQSFGASFIPADYRTASVFYEYYEEPVYAQKLLPAAPGGVAPLIYEFGRHGAVSPEEWKNERVRYDKALIYIYCIDRDICERYPMVAFNAAAQASALLFLADISELSSGEDELYDPWLGFLTETMRKVYGSMAVDKPAAVVIDKLDKAVLNDKRWRNVLKAVHSGIRTEGAFPERAYAKLSKDIKAAMASDHPGYFSALEALFPDDRTMYFGTDSFYDLRSDSSADIHPAASPEIPFWYLLSKLNLLIKL